MATAQKRKRASELLGEGRRDRGLMCLGDVHQSESSKGQQRLGVFTALGFILSVPVRVTLNFLFQGLTL